jgi:glycine betaine/proline transport system ATP-binding protein
MPDQPIAEVAAPIQVRNLWKVFGSQPERVIQQIQGGASKADVLGQSGQVVAVQDVSFDVHEGETFVVMGLSGSGKSTLLRCLPRLIEPTAGSVRIDGSDVAQLNAQEMRDLRRHRMSMVFQHFGLLPHRRIIDNVAYGLEVQGVPRKKRYERSLEVLALVNLAGWENHYPNQLSGGMQQRVGLARALAVDPEILLFDEPFSALDPLIRREMQDELVSLQARMRKTLVFITHDFAEAIKLGARIAIMKDGQFVQVGAPEEIVLRPADSYVAEFTRDVPRLQVLTARSLMSPVAADEPAAGEVRIQASARLNECIAPILQADNPLPVCDETGAIVGQLGRINLLAALEPAR